MIFDSLSTFFLLSILKNLDLEFLFFAGSIEEIFDEIIEIFESKVFNDYYFVEKGKDIKIPVSKFILHIIGNWLAFIGFLVYLEIIELNFCGLNYNLRRKIIERSIEESISDIGINEDQDECLFDDNTSNINTELSHNN